jgi:vacuolar-type H+-ATPase subunit I/STV1
MTMDLPGWKRKRTTVKAKITRIESFVKAFKDGDDLFQLESRVPHLENAFKEFEEYRNQIEQFEEDDNTRKEVEIQYHNTIAKIKNLTSNVTSTCASTHNNSGGNIQSSSELAVKLATLNLPQFSEILRSMVAVL